MGEDTVAEQIQIINQFLSVNQINICFKYMLVTEFDTNINTILFGSKNWYITIQRVLDTFKACDDIGYSSEFDFLYMQLNCLDRLMTLSGNDNNAHLLFKLDQTLFESLDKMDSFNENQNLVTEMLVFFKGQLFFHVATILSNRADTTKIAMLFFWMAATARSICIERIKHLNEGILNRCKIYQEVSDARILQASEKVKSANFSFNLEVSNILADSAFETKLYCALFENINGCETSQLSMELRFMRSSICVHDGISKQKISLCKSIELVESQAEPMELTETLTEPNEMIESLAELIEWAEILVEPIETTESLAEPTEMTESLAEPFELTDTLAEPTEMIESLAEPIELAQPIKLAKSSKSKKKKREKVASHKKEDKIGTTCNVCGSSYSSISNLKTHIETVHEGRRFVCSLCEDLFTTNSSLQRHASQMHGIKVAGELIVIETAASNLDAKIDQLEKEVDRNVRKIAFLKAQLNKN